MLAQGRSTSLPQSEHLLVVLQRASSQCFKAQDSDLIGQLSKTLRNKVRLLVKIVTLCQNCDDLNLVSVKSNILDIIFSKFKRSYSFFSVTTGNASTFTCR